MPMPILPEDVSLEGRLDNRCHQWRAPRLERHLFDVKEGCVFRAQESSNSGHSNAIAEVEMGLKTDGDEVIIIILTSLGFNFQPST